MMLHLKMRMSRSSFGIDIDEEKIKMVCAEIINIASDSKIDIPVVKKTITF